MTDCPIFDAESLEYEPLTDAERDALVNDAMDYADAFVREQLPTYAARFVRPAPEQVHSTLNNVLKRLAYECAIDYEPPVVWLSDIGAHLAAAVISLGFRQVPEVSQMAG